VRQSLHSAEDPGSLLDLHRSFGRLCDGQLLPRRLLMLAFGTRRVTFGRECRMPQQIQIVVSMRMSLE
jgi:hypothetical protein